MRRFVALALCAGLALSSCGGTGQPASEPSAGGSTGADRDAVRAVVAEFGKRLQRVSLLAPRSQLLASVAAEYAPLVAPELLQAWMREPESAPGRRTSSPWPDHIEIDTTMVDSAGVWTVRGAIVEMTSAGAAGRVPVHAEVGRRNERWVLTAFGSADAGTDETAAPEVLRAYYGAITDRRFRDAYRLWASEGAASGKTFEQFEAGFANTAAVDVEVGSPGPMGAAAGSRYIEVPVRISARLRDGARQEFTGTYTLRRSVVDGATPDQRSWRIYSAAVRQVK
jgi:hypothetical protein